MMTILEEITDFKKSEVAEAKKRVELQALKDCAFFHRKCFSLVDNLSGKTGIIAEFKRRSPSRADINVHSSVQEVTAAYAQFGASGISVLTDRRFFGGGLDDLQRARTHEIPLLRKDFMIDEYQFYEAKANGADVVLLIAACLSRMQVNEFSHLAQELGLEVFLEIHDESELAHIGPRVDLVGVNNRNLKNFVVDIERSIALKDKLPEGIPSVAESGIGSAETFKHLRNAGFSGFLMGEYFMKEHSPGMAFEKFVNEISAE